MFQVKTTPLPSCTEMTSEKRVCQCFEMLYEDHCRREDLCYGPAQLHCMSLHLDAGDLVPAKRLRIPARNLRLDFSGTISGDYLRGIARAFPHLEALTLSFLGQDSVQLRGAKFPKLVRLQLNSPCPFGILLDFIPRCPRLAAIASALGPARLKTMQANFPRIHFSPLQ